MDIIRKIEVFGDSILKGIQINPLNKRYHVDNNIGVDTLSEEFSLSIVNHSKLGCTVTKGKALLDKFLDKNPDCTAIVMDFGGNDCDYDWKAISEHPDGKHEPNTPMKTFVKTYIEIIENIYANGIRPIVTNLPPICPHRYFDWFSKNLDKNNLLKWLEDINVIYRHQESYSHSIEKLAKSTGTMLVDLRGIFLSERNLTRFLCEDGIHPNTEGQKLITHGFIDFCKTIPAYA
jgi:lysophospholipase L1-like esterase